MKLKIEVKSYNNYPPHSHTSGGGGGLLDLPCTQGQSLMDAKLFNGTTRYQKLLLSPIPKFVIVRAAPFFMFFSLPLIQEKQPVSYWPNKMFAK